MKLTKIILLPVAKVAIYFLIKGIYAKAAVKNIFAAKPKYEEEIKLPVGTTINNDNTLLSGHY